ncbi:EamA family transporter [Cohnella sp. LGH]|nr:EamA family transporter [Cohnella sp. LGH]
MCNTVGNTLWKYYFAKHTVSFSSVGSILSILFSFQVILGVVFYFGSMLLFLFLLSRNNLSLVIPLTSLTYILNICAGVLIFKEKVSMLQAVGSVIVFIGILVMMSSGVIKGK